MLHLDLFSGIGGFALATEMVWGSVEHIFCDNDLFCQAIIKKHWPNSKIYGDINELITDTESWKSRQQTEQKGRQDFERGSWQTYWLEVATELCRVDDGIPRRLDRNPRLKALGNAIVPQVAVKIMNAML